MIKPWHIHITLKDPVEVDNKSSACNRNKLGDVQNVKTMIQATGAKLRSLGKYPITHVKYHWHTTEKYKLLTDAQKASLKAWKHTPPGRQAAKVTSHGTRPQGNRNQKWTGKGNKNEEKSPRIKQLNRIEKKLAKQSKSTTESFETVVLNSSSTIACEETDSNSSSEFWIKVKKRLAKGKKHTSNKKRGKGTASLVHAASLTPSAAFSSKSVLRNAITKKTIGKKKCRVQIAVPSSNKRSYDSDSS